MDRVSLERPGLEDRTFLSLVVVLSVGFAAVLWPFAGAILWALVIATVLWGAFMAVLSLLPAVGTALVWLPTAVYLMVTGEAAKGIILAVYGLLVIGSVDNVLRSRRRSAAASQSNLRLIP